MRTTRLGELEVSVIGLGCNNFGRNLDLEQSRAVVQQALDVGITYFDTARTYGEGNSEAFLAGGLGRHREEVVIATKFGRIPRLPDIAGAGRDDVRRTVEESLTALGTDYIDLYQLHLNDLPISQAEDLLSTLEDLVDAGTLRWYGWSTDFPDRAAAWGRDGRHCTAIQHNLSVLHDAAEVLEVCRTHRLASLNRGPLAMGMLTGKFSASSTLGTDDVRGVAPEWLIYFRDGRPAPEWLERVAAVRDVLTGGGRTLAQGALAWIWARSDLTIPIPGCRTVAQIEENAAAIEHGPLSPDELAEVERLLVELRGQPVRAM